jgi:hypothetical protein
MPQALTLGGNLQKKVFHDIVGVLMKSEKMQKHLTIIYILFKKAEIWTNDFWWVNIGKNQETFFFQVKPFKKMILH